MATRSDKGGDLERSLALLWRGHSHGQRGPRPRLSVEQIAQAAIRVADAEGLEALSMQRVATELGYATMSIYNHIPSKDLLLEVMADVAAGRPPAHEATADWRRAVLLWASDLWMTFLNHPWVLRIPLHHAPMGPNQLAWLDRLLQHLLAGGVKSGEAMAAALHLISVVRGTAQVSSDLTRFHGTADQAVQADAEAARLLAEVMDPQQFPALTAVSAAEASAAKTAATKAKSGAASATAKAKAATKASATAKAQAAAGTPEDEVALPAELRFGVERFLDGLESWTARNGADGA